MAISIAKIPDNIFREYSNKNAEMLEEAILNGILLSDDVTNGDVIKALFPNIEKDNGRLIQEYGSRALYDTFEKWCELPYKVGDTDGNS